MIIKAEFLKYLPPCDKYDFALIYALANNINDALLYFTKNNKQHLIISDVPDECYSVYDECCDINSIKSLWSEVLLYTSSTEAEEALRKKGYKVTSTFNSYINYPFVKTNAQSIIQFLMEDDK